jgi:superfamily II helicase
MKGSSEKPIPINKVCRICKKKKLLTEFEIDESANDRHSTVCKTCHKHDVNITLKR